MAIEILVELAASLIGQIVMAPATSKANKWLRERRIKEFYESLKPEMRQGFLELIVFATLEDAKISDDEKKFLGELREMDSNELLDNALKEVTQQLPFPDEQSEMAFLKEKAALFPDEKHRERIFTTLIFILYQADSTGVDRIVERVGVALEISEKQAGILIGEYTTRFLALKI
jgi:hypothetical protein